MAQYLFKCIVYESRSGNEKVNKRIVVQAAGNIVYQWLRWYTCTMNDQSGLAGWTPEQIAQGKSWVEAWKRAGEALEQIRREELRNIDQYKAIELLCGPADYTVPPRAPKPTSGLIEQQRWFMKAAENLKARQS